MIIGIILILIGLILRMMAVRINKGFSLILKKPDILCTNGIYKYMRHPAYAGSIIMILGMYILNSVIAFTYLVFVFFLSRALSEEQILELTYKEYNEYKKKTGMFFPKIRRKKCKS